MKERLLYEYAVIRAVPCVEREEFVNVGVILYCKKAGFLRLLFDPGMSKIKTLDKDADIHGYNRMLSVYEKICNGDEKGGPIALLTMPERFRWLTAVKSTVLQMSAVHPGLTEDPKKELKRLFDQLVN